MKRNHMIFALAFLIVMAGCGKKSEVADKGPQSFSMAQSNQASGTDNQPKATQSDAGNSAANSASSSASPSETNKADVHKPAPAAQAVPEASPSAAQPAPVQTSAAAAEKTPAVKGTSPAAPSNAPAAPQNKTAPASKEAEPVNPAPAAKEAPVSEVKPEKKNAAAATNSGATNSNEIKWSEFFDNDKQTTPSNKFWDLNGKTVQIKGFMGEVLSFEKHWFLIIPQPGAECPFDNGDESYWNKIMIAFVPDDTKLRFTSGPLKITGRLDVGIKLDQSGYKTMFRLYDAHFEKIKE